LNCTKTVPSGRANNFEIASGALAAGAVKIKLRSGESRLNYECVRVSIADHITRVTLNRPDSLNSINQLMHDELQEVFDQFAADDDQYLCVIAGTGERAFSAGSDLKSIAKRGKSHDYPRSGYAGLIERFELDKPLIAAVDGVAVGGGFELALACDILIATRRSRFGLPEPLIGAIAIAGGMHRLSRQVGLKQAMGLILTGDIIDAEVADRMGIITQLVDHDELDETVDMWCEKILRCAPLAVRASKQTVMRGLDEASLEDAMRHQETYPTFKVCYNSTDKREGASAFSEKRPPQWTGK
jgi:enoyl-CoA hydratase/carnithine racemase